MPTIPLSAVASVLLCMLSFAAVAEVSAQDAAVRRQARAVADAWLQARVHERGGDRARIEMDVVLPARAMPPCPQPYTIEVADGHRLDRLLLLAGCPQTGAADVRLVARAQIHVQGVVARTAVPGGRVLQASALQLADVDLAQVPDAVFALDAAVGRSTRRSLRPGEPLQSSLLLSSEGVRRGESVQIIAGRDGFRVSVAGIALQDGAPGERIQVRNVGTGRVLNVQVSGDGIVEASVP
jgi:flagellar basal body P-ring formation protein FlgA